MSTIALLDDGPEYGLPSIISVSVFLKLMTVGIFARTVCIQFFLVAEGTVE